MQTLSLLLLRRCSLPGATLYTNRQYKGRNVYVFVTTKKNSANTGARADNALQVTKPPPREAC